MKLHTVATLLASTALAAAIPALAATGNFDRTLKVAGPVLLGLDNGSGDVHVVSGPTTTVHIVGHVRSDGGMFGHGNGDDNARVQAVVANPPITQAGNILSVGHNFHAENINIDYEITVPRGTDLRINTGSGTIRAENTGGPSELTTGSGDVKASGLSDHVSLQTGSGSIDATLDSARDVKAQTGSGDITLSNVQGGLWAHTGSGSIKVQGRPLNAMWKLESGSGDVRLQTGSAAFDLDATTGSGDIHTNGGTLSASQVNEGHTAGKWNGGGPKVRVSTGSGSISVN